LYIKTDTSIGMGNSWSPAQNNGQTMGTVTLSCSAEAAVQKNLYYQSGTSVPPSGKICVGDYCNAPICTDTICWGSNPTSTQPAALAAYIGALAPDFAYFIKASAAVSAFAWTSVWSEVEGVWAAQVSYVRTDIQDTVTTQIQSALADNTGAATSVFGLVVSFDGGLSGESQGYIYIGTLTPGGTNLGGYVDVLFFGGSNEQPQCNIHSSCGRYSCYTYANLLGQYSGDPGHIQEGQCIQDIPASWGYLTIRINTARTGGYFRRGCDQNCFFCSSDGNFTGDACTCVVDDTTTYNCFSVKFAAGSLVAPSLVFFLTLLSLFKAI